MIAEQRRLSECQDRTVHWRRWGPYLSERAWGTVREDYSTEGAAWEYFTHDQARSRAFRWSEDGIAGICDRKQRICFAIALWNGQDPILKERLFGLTGPEGNHGEDVKELYYYLDSTPTHSFMRMLYKYPQATFPYERLVEENAKRSKLEPEFELIDTDVFDEDRYFDVEVQYAKADFEDILIRVEITNRGPSQADLHFLPTIWFRNTWSWDVPDAKPHLYAGAMPASIDLDEPELGRRRLYCDGNPELLFTENETNRARLFGVANASPFVKDGINDAVVHANTDAVNVAGTGTKASAHYQFSVPAGETITIKLRLTDRDFSAHDMPAPFGDSFDHLFELRRREADEFYGTVIPENLDLDAKNVMRQSFAGMLWSKQYYHYVVKKWLEGDPLQPTPPPNHQHGRNADWAHVHCADVISMPDKWEYPWFAAWDLAFHCVSLAIIDAEFAKDQLVLLLREWYMHPNGQIPAYEWTFSDVNPPVHGWAALRVFRIDKKRTGKPDYDFLKRIFHKLEINFTWWVNRKDASGRNLFQGGFLGLDNIGVFDRSAPLPTGGYLDQADGTAWMAMYSLNLMAIALELAEVDQTYGDVASKFWEHFTYIAKALCDTDGNLDLWDPVDGFFYDLLCLPCGDTKPLKVRSMVGLIPLYAVETLEADLLDRLPEFKTRLEWFIDHRPDLTRNVASMRDPGSGARRLLSIVDADQLRRILATVLDEHEFLSPFGIRSVSKFHRDHPYSIAVDGHEFAVHYEPAESKTGVFGGNSNWRGPIWMPTNYVFIESLQKYHHYYGDDFKVECPTGSGVLMTLNEVAAELSKRLCRLFLKSEAGTRPVHGESEKYRIDPAWRDLILFHEYFDGDTGRGLGASHQTGWTGLVAKLLQQTGSTL